MSRWLKLSGVAILISLAAYFAPSVRVWLSSEAVLDRRYGLARSLVRADETPGGLARGARLVRLSGCTGCHGADLLGRPMPGRVFRIYAGNLRAPLRTYSDEDFDRALRRGVRPDASSLWLMPSQAYVYMHDNDVAAIIGYLRSLPPGGRLSPAPEFNWPAREKIVSGELRPVAPLAMGAMPAIDAGPHYSGGRYIAMIACGSCHGTELSGPEDGRAPDLDVVTRYSRTQFFELMRKGTGVHGRKLKIMGPLAKQRFQILQDWEIDPLYAYLIARANAPRREDRSGAARYRW